MCVHVVRVCVFVCMRVCVLFVCICMCIVCVCTYVTIKKGKSDDRGISFSQTDRQSSQSVK